MSEGAARKPPKRIWLLVDRDAIPTRFDGRVIDLGLVPMLPSEVASFLRHVPDRDQREERTLAALVAQRVPAAQIAERLQVSRRTAYRRIDALKKSVGATTYGELAASLRERGF